MTKRTASAAVLAAVLAAGGAIWVAAGEHKSPPPAGKDEVGQEKEKPSVPAKPHAGRPRRSRLAWLFGKGFDSGKIPKGYRAASVAVREYELLAVRPGDRVDVLVTFEANMADRKEKVTATILQNVVVLGVDLSGELRGVGVVHLLVNPNEAQYAALSAYQAEMDIVLRGEGDEEMRPMEMASFRKLFR
ncbi:MAG: hypothetical protein HY927_14185 [Elusimicrobia bacterium]|nr:hypothetical protein [Elusimicrobiota bacterium]